MDGNVASFGSSEAVIKRIPPHDTLAEQSVLGAMILDNDTIDEVANIVSASDFYNKQYQIVFDAIMKLHEAGSTVDAVTLQDKLKSSDLPPEAANAGLIAELLAAVPVSAKVKDYAKIVYDKSMLRQLIKTTTDISTDCYNGRKTLPEIMNDTEQKIFNLLQSRNTGDEEPLRTTVVRVILDIENASKTRGNITGIPTGFTDLDYKTAGLQNSDFILIAARPSMGKTAFALNLTHYISIKKHKAIVFFSLEMSRDQLVKRLLAQNALVDSQKIRTGELDASEWFKLADASRAVGGANLTIEDTPGISVAEVRTRCRKLKLENKLDLVMIDYLQLMSGRGRVESRQQEISEISRSLKALARELDVPVIALSQLSRECEKRDDKRPMLSDLRESGAIEQDADMVMFLYRDEYYNKDTDNPGVTELIISKQRNGPTGTVKLGWQGQYTRFVNLAKE